MWDSKATAECAHTRPHSAGSVWYSAHSKLWNVSEPVFPKRFQSKAGWVHGCRSCRHRPSSLEVTCTFCSAGICHIRCGPWPGTSQVQNCKKSVSFLHKFLHRTCYFFPLYFYYNCSRILVIRISESDPDFSDRHTRCSDCICPPFCLPSTLT